MRGKTLREVGNPQALAEYNQYLKAVAEGEQGILRLIRGLYYEFDDPSNNHILGTRSTWERVPAVVDVLNPIKSDIVLDIGAGHGAISYRVVLQGATCVALDISEQPLRIAQKVMQQLGVKNLPSMIVADGCTLPFASKAFNKVVCADVWEHLTPTQKDALLSEVRRVLKPGGKFVIASPNKLRAILGLIKWKVWALLHGVNPKDISIAWSQGEEGHIGLDYPWTMTKRLRKVLGDQVQVVPTLTFLRGRKANQEPRIVKWACRLFPFLRIVLSARIIAVWHKGVDA